MQQPSGHKSSPHEKPVKSQKSDRIRPLERRSFESHVTVWELLKRNKFALVKVPEDRNVFLLYLLL